MEKVKGKKKGNGNKKSKETGHHKLKCGKWKDGKKKYMRQNMNKNEGGTTEEAERKKATIT